MSYILQVFRPPQGVRPLRPADVVATIERLHEEPPPAESSASRALVRLLKASASPAQRGEWMEALAEDDASPVFNMAVETARAGQLVPLVVRCARTLGLAVLDGQAAIAYWPDGVEIRMLALAPTPGLPDAVGASHLDPLQLAPGHAYRLHCGYFTLNEQLMAGKLPEMLAQNTRPGHLKPYGWMMALQDRLLREFGGKATADSIWAEDLASAQELYTVMPLAIKAERIKQARPRILEIVHSVDMSVFDPHAMQVHFPDGRVCWRGEQWHAPGSEGRRLDADLPAAEAARLVAAQLEPYGFAHDGARRLVRRFPDVEQTILVYGSHWSVSVNVWLEVTRRTDLPDHVVPSGIPEKRDTVGIYGQLSDFVSDEDFDEPLFFDRESNRLNVRRRSMIPPAADEIARVLVQRVLPYYDARTSIQAIHSAVNGPGAQEHPVWPVQPSKRLVIACMAGEPRLPEMAAQELEKLRGWKYEPGGQGLDRTQREQELPKVEGLVAWLGRLR
jgi:hypothetical protein